jgi:hypothetical protein
MGGIWTDWPNSGIGSAVYRVQEARSGIVSNQSLLTASLLLAAIGTVAAEPLFHNSVVSNDLDFIREDDPEAEFCLQYLGASRAEMPDKRSDILFVDDVHIFRAVFAQSNAIEIWVHPEVGDKTDAEAIVDPVLRAIARLPQPMRELLNHAVIHEGNETAFSEDRGRFFVMYTENIRSRISTQDISETVFHESVHATLDIPHAASSEWQAAQEADGDFVTEYAQKFPKQEDMAESALFAWTVLKHPGRLPPEIEARVAGLIPNRLAYFQELFRDWEPVSSQDAGLEC